jgi:hypothetical protein
VLPAFAAPTEAAEAELEAKACLFLRIDLMPSEPEVKSSRLPCPLLLAPLFFKIEEMAPAILWSGLALPKLSFRFKIP